MLRLDDRQAFRGLGGWCLFVFLVGGLVWGGSFFCLWGGSKAFAVGYACDSLLFIPAGYVMDTYGRKYAGLPAYLLLSVGLAAVPLVASLPGLILVSIVMGLGNGCSAGLNVTLGKVALKLFFIFFCQRRRVLYGVDTPSLHPSTHAGLATVTRRLAQHEY